MRFIKAFSIPLAIIPLFPLFESSGQAAALSPAAAQILLFVDHFEFTVLERVDVAVLTSLSSRKIDLPHDWAVEGEFSEYHPCYQTVGVHAISN